MHIGNLILISPVIYLIFAAVAVLIAGVIAGRDPKGRLEHFLSAHYLAPALTVPAVILSGGVVALSLGLVGRLATVTLGNQVLRVPSTSLFVTAGGHAQLTVDPFAAIFTFVALAGTLVVMLLSIDHFGEHQIHKGEYYATLMFAAAAASLLAAASDLIAIYLSIEFLSMTSYVLAAWAKTDRRSGEAGLKYFLYGAACSATMLYGMSILFGVTGGQTSLSAIAAHFTSAGAAATGAGFVGVMFMLVGFGFKIALAPFQFWAPDTYEGAPTPVTAFLSVVSKAAGLAVVVRFLLVVAVPGAAAALSWYWVLVVLTGLSMFLGNLIAIPQRNIKRMLAYSSIAQVGYMMVGVLAAMHVFTRQATAAGMVRANVAAATWDIQGVIIYMLAYLVMNLGAFSVVVAVGRRLGSDNIDDYAGLMQRSPFFASALTVFLVSLAGVPPTAGFLGKFFVFGSAIRTGQSELLWLALIGVVNSVISAYYYFNVLRLMFFAKGESAESLRGGFAANTAVAVTLTLTLAMIVFARPVSDLAACAVYATEAVSLGGHRDNDGIQRFRPSAAPQLSTQTGENAADYALSQQPAPAQALTSASPTPIIQNQSDRNE